MPCPTCDGTMAYLSDNVMHCERCGTAKQTVLGNVYVPKLVERCREFAKLFSKDAPQWLDRAAGNAVADLGSEFRRLGIAESIAPPEKRA